MAAASVKDAVKALESVFAGPTVAYPLPDELQQTIEAFVDRHHDIDDQDSQRLHDELLQTYNNHVQDEPIKRSAFLSVLRQVRPAIRGDARLSQWWNLVIKPVIDGVGHKRDEIEDAREFVLGILAYEADGDDDAEHAQAAASYTQKLLECYLRRTRMPTGESDVITPEDEYVAREIESLLVMYGRRKPKELLLSLNNLFVQAKHRVQALGLLCTFVRVQPPHLYLVSETPLVENLEKCLMIDKSATVVEMALTVLIMFMPHITRVLVSHMPKLFLIYSRVLCWDQVTAPMPNETQKTEEAIDTDSDEDSSDDDRSDPTWERLEHAFDHPETSAPGALYYFTFIYGLFPVNLMSYVRKPRRFLKNINYLGADDLVLDPEAIRRRTEPFRQVHLLHPNFFNMTAEEEMSESRWLKSDPADVVTECMSLCMAVSASLDDPGPPPTAKLPDLPQPTARPAHVSLVPTEDIPPLDEDGTTSPTDGKPSSSWRNTQSTTLTNPSSKDFAHPRKLSPQPLGASPDSPTLPGATVPQLAEKEQPQNLETSSALLASPRLEAFTQTLSANHYPLSHTHARLAQNLATLQREVMLLRNDLNFERYLKAQHLSHIGQLQRRHIKEATVEAETQNLINTNRTLKAKLQKANELYAQLKKETMTGRNQSKKWEGELGSKLKTFRDEQKQWHSEEELFKAKLARAEKDCERLRRLLVEAEARELNSKQNLKSIEVELEEMGTLKQEIESLQARLRDFELRELDFEHAKDEQEMLRNELKLANMKLDSQDAERNRIARAYDRKFAQIESRQPVDIDTKHDPTQLPASVQQMIDSALAASHSKFNQLRKTHNRLLHRFTELEMKCQALEAEVSYARGRTGGNGHGSHDAHSPIDEHSSSGFIRKPSTAGSGSIASSRGASFANRYGPRTYAEPLRMDVRSDDEFDDDYSEFNYPTSSFSGYGHRPFTARPERSESLPTRTFHPMDTLGPTSEPQSPTDTIHAPRFHAFNPTEPLGSSDGRSTFSANTNGSGSDKDNKVAKITPKSEVRVYGRGGAQNVGKKKDHTSKSGTGGFRGFKGLMSQN
ncbi:Hamartin [Lasiodiplodia theobromae]|uniref:Hamartin n=1 Tax=Lasiodiplodia theobromae TaxID=45133 RepID=A0A5N5DU16_9PEZI|nr:Hamartin [Lasiodiplodia theobromae]KAB2581203.1 Tuberous sclerosis 1 protein-like protein [Lasiodiplodia theobromae]KAF4541666.1 Hamartin [Lasiodiplodia theobromae]KAF9629679.1 Hamartin [Lasiodiplodia theobromae]